MQNWTVTVVTKYDLLTGSEREELDSLTLISSPWWISSSCSRRARSWVSRIPASLDRGAAET